jgi:2-oxoglutarate dehydrogenase dihydrolipoamide succinyltransferase (E2 component)
VSSSPTESGTTIEVTMPQMGVSVAEGTITEWMKRPGDWVEADETICMVTTDKVDVEIPAPASGRLARIAVEPDQTVPVGTVLGEIDSAAKPGDPHPEEAGDGAQAKAAETAPAQAEETAAGAPPESAPDQGDGVPEQGDRAGFYSPVVRRIADKHGVDLSRVKGTGLGGRVRKKDVLAFIESGEAGEGEPATAEAAPAERPLHIESPYQPEAPAPAAANGGTGPAPAPADGGAVAIPERREPMSPMRKRIAEHMLASRHTSAHCTTIVEADLSKVAARRQELKEPMARRGVRLTYLAFVARATVDALQKYPILNARLDGEEIVYQDQINLGIAVALENGLIVPVIRQAERLSLEGLAAGIADVAERARSGKLEPDDVHGGTFTITNPGQFGAVLATPIINQPQVAILDLEAIVKRPVVISEDGTDAIAIRPMTYLCMSWDHRALDGAVAARFLAQIKETLEGWEER